MFGCASLLRNYTTQEDGRTALFEASLEGHVAIVRLLLEKRADVNICAKVRNVKQVQCLFNTQHTFTVRVTIR